MGNAVLGHLRVHLTLQSRRARADTLPATIALAEGQRAVDLATPDHPFFLNMPIWRPPGVILGPQMSTGFAESGRFTFWHVPPYIRAPIGEKIAALVTIMNTSPPHNLPTFARGSAALPYGNAAL